jgi:hypothetical protein
LFTMTTRYGLCVDGASIHKKTSSPPAELDASRQIVRKRTPPPSQTH